MGGWASPSRPRASAGPYKRKRVADAKAAISEGELWEPFAPSREAAPPEAVPCPQSGSWRVLAADGRRRGYALPVASRRRAATCSREGAASSFLRNASSFSARTKRLSTLM